MQIFMIINYYFSLRQLKESIENVMFGPLSMIIEEKI